MTVRQLFDFIKGVRPGFAFTDAQMMVWLNEIEGKVQTDIMLLDPAVGEDGTVTGLVEYDVTTDMDTELIVPFPWNKLYRYFMLMSIDLYNGEFQRYGNSFAQFNEAYEEYAAWYAQNIAPANGLAVAHGYYLTAYQFAVRGGYTGTEEEFTKSLGALDDFARIQIVNHPYVTPQEFGAKADGVTDDGDAIIAALKCACIENRTLYFPTGTYAFAQDAIFQQVNADQESRNHVLHTGLVVRGDGPYKSVLKLTGLAVASGNEASKKWFYKTATYTDPNEPELDRREKEEGDYNRTTFYDLGFDAYVNNTTDPDNPQKPDFGNGFYIFSSRGLEKQLSFYNCQFNVGTVLYTAGRTNADLNRFINCGFHAYDAAFVSNNSQSLDNEIIASKGRILKDLCRVIKGGNFKFIGGSYDLYQVDPTSKYDMDDGQNEFCCAIMAENDQSTGNGDNTFINVRFEFHGNRGFFNGSVGRKINVLFQRCTEGNTPSKTEFPNGQLLANVYDNNNVVFSYCAIQRNTTFNVSATRSIGGSGNPPATTTGAVLGFENCLLDTCHNADSQDDYAPNFREMISLAGDSYVVYAKGCRVGLGYPFKTTPKLAPIDFYITSKYGARFNSGDIKHYEIKPDGVSFPYGTSSSKDVLCYIPAGVYIKSIYFKRKAIVTSNEATITYYIGSDDKTAVLGQTTAAGYNTDVELEIKDVGVVNFDVLCVWATISGSGTPADENCTNGIIYMEYV